MIARLWWKETRQVWPVWAFLAATGLAIQAFAAWYWGAEAGPAGHLATAMVITFMYLFLIAAAVFAGERESGTLVLLDAIPVERWRVWAAKAGFAVGTTALLGVVLWAGARAFGSVEAGKVASVGGVMLLWGVTAMGWGLFWSAIMSNALTSAITAMVSLCVSLVVLANLQVEPSASESSPWWLLAISLLTTTASAWIFHLGGPPRWQPGRRERPLAPASAGTLDEKAERIERPVRRIWTAAAPRLAWKTLREVRGELWTLVVLSLVVAAAPFRLAWRVQDAGPFTLVAMSFLAILTGVAAFNVENRKGTQRFLLRHGARPGMVWAVKTSIWWAVTVALWAVVSAPFWLSAPIFTASQPTGTLAAQLPLAVQVLYWGLGALTIPFATAILCGMVFRRGIMSGSIAVVACSVLAGLLGFLLYAQVSFPWHWPYIAAAILAVGWAWSGDWQLDRPGLARWGRLALYVAAVPVVLVPAYIGGRTWAVPAIPAQKADAIFEPRRFTYPAPEDDNAAPLYLQAGRLLTSAFAKGPAAHHLRPENPDWDPTAPGVAQQLVQIEPALALLREGAGKTTCQYVDPSKETLFDRPEEPRTNDFSLALSASALARLDRGDLEGSWSEIETLLRIARQYSYTNSAWMGDFFLDPWGTSLAMRWAADPRQTAASLEKAARAWAEIPPRMSPADRVRADAVVFHNTLALPRAELSEKLFFRWNDPQRKRKPSPAEKLKYDLQTTPWEVARARKVYDLLAAAKIQAYGRGVDSYDPKGLMAYAGSPWAAFPVHRDWILSAEDSGIGRVVSPQELAELAGTTPLLREVVDSPAVVNSRLDFAMDRNREAQNETFRRALSLILHLRLYQARHDGALPPTLADLPIDAAGDSPALSPEERRDPYAEKSFGYVPSQGQRLLPLGSIHATNRVNDVDDPRMKTTEGCKLLYSVGPDGVDDRAARDVNFFYKGDYVFPLKDGVKPPAAAP